MIPLYVAIGGALGAVARFELAGWVQARTGSAFPWGTFLVNLIGCFLIGLVLRYLVAAGGSAESRAFLAVGVLGGFTTFSTFGYEVVGLLQGGEWTRAAAYALGSLVVGVAAVFAGLAVAGPFLPAR